MDRTLYEQHAALERDHWWFVGRRAVVAAVLDAHVPRPIGRIFDAGCGTGGMLPMLAERGEVVGIEVEPTAVEHCHRTHPTADVRRGDVPGDVPRDGSFDLACAFDVIEHLADDVAALGALRDAVRPGGHVVVTVPALPWLWSDHDVVNGHHRRYTDRMLTAAVAAAGLDLVHRSYFNTALLPAVAAARLSQRLRPRRATPTSDFSSMPGPAANRVLAAIFGAERHVAARRRLPIGVSLIAVARRPAAS